MAAGRQSVLRAVSGAVWAAGAAAPLPPVRDAGVPRVRAVPPRGRRERADMRAVHHCRPAADGNSCGGGACACRAQTAGAVANRLGVEHLLMNLLAL